MIASGSGYALRPAPCLPLSSPPLRFHGRSSERGGEWQQQLAPGLAALGLERVQLVWLLANTQHEMTCVAWKAGFGNGSSAAAASGSAQSAAAVGDGS